MFDLLYAFVPFLFNLFSADRLLILQNIYQTGFHILFAINLSFIVITNISRLSKKNKLALLYGIANIPVIAGTIIYYTNYYRITAIAFGWLNPVALGLSIETFALSFGFAYRFNLINKEKTGLLLEINKQQQHTTQQIIAVQEAEHKRISEDLHDELDSKLAALKINFQTRDLQQTIETGKYKQLIGMIEQTSNDLRRIAHNLMPPDFAKTKLSDLLSAHINRLNNEQSQKFTFIVSG